MLTVNTPTEPDACQMARLKALHVYNHRIFSTHSLPHAPSSSSNNSSSSTWTAEGRREEGGGGGGGVCTAIKRVEKETVSKEGREGDVSAGSGEKEREEEEEMNGDRRGWEQVVPGQPSQPAAAGRHVREDRKGDSKTNEMMNIEVIRLIVYVSPMSSLKRHPTTTHLAPQPHLQPLGNHTMEDQQQAHVGHLGRGVGRTRELSEQA
ncbi:hypothetical protein O3P69_003835 [Scylla paramamosain]|uniref:Uncharacterized protein n=1 Tax=Scylla paramamosain TaxID=85552 RepID=A0AAW0UHN8_SCYPA